MAVDNPQSSSSYSASSATHPADMQARARKREAIGLAPDRETAPDAYLRPPDDSSHAAQWLLVCCVALLGLAVVLLLVARFLNPDSTLAGLFGLPPTVEQEAAAVTPDSARSATQPVFAALPGYQLWLADDFVAPSQLAPEQATPGQVSAAVIAGAGVYRMQVSPNQMGWTLFDLADANSYRLETSATVNADTPSGAAGLLARFAGAGNFYQLTIDGAGAAAVQLWLDGQPYPLPALSAAVTPNPVGQANRLAVEDDGARLRFYVNQTVLAEVLDPQLPAGRPGISTTAAGSIPASVDFDWIAIYRPQP